MIWEVSHRADPRARAVADRHYSRQTVGHPQFVQPGRCLVLYAETLTGRAYWVTSWPFPEHVKHDWPTAWQCSAFRNEGAGMAVDMIRQAVAATRAALGDPPLAGMVTFVDERRVRPTKVRGQPIYGWTFRRAGFREIGRTRTRDYLALGLHPWDMPAPAPARGLLL